MRYGYRNSNIIWVLLGLNVLVFLVTIIRPDLVFLMAFTKPFNVSEFWTLLTSMFVHAGFYHLFANMITLYFFGVFCLQLINGGPFLAVYFIGGIAGSLMYLLIGPENSMVVGASGAVTAIGGLLMVMRPTQRVLMYFIPMPLWLAIVIGFLLTAFVGGVAWQAHLGGLIVGVIAGLIFRRRERMPVRPGYYQVRF
jgi:membrane associated rhomboid family serine protease